jgi:hypothetical protein
MPQNWETIEGYNGRDGPWSGMPILHGGRHLRRRMVGARAVQAIESLLKPTLATRLVVCSETRPSHSAAAGGAGRRNPMSHTTTSGTANPAVVLLVACTPVATKVYSGVTLLAEVQHILNPKGPGMSVPAGTQPADLMRILEIACAEIARLMELTGELSASANLWADCYEMQRRRADRAEARAKFSSGATE